MIGWAQGNPEFMAAYADKAHPHHAEAASYATWPFFFGHDYPQNANGEPVEWDQVRTADDDAAPAEPEGEDVFKDWPPDRARQRLDEALKDPRFAEWRAAYSDRQNPDHELAKREFARLHEIAYPEPAGETASPDYENRDTPSANPGAAAPPIGSPPVAGASARSAPLDQATALRRVDELYRDQEFLSRYQSLSRDVRAAATAEMSVVLQAAYPEPAPPAADDGGAAAAAA